jgi:hypothetical protein
MQIRLTLILAATLGCSSHPAATPPAPSAHAGLPPIEAPSRDPSSAMAGAEAPRSSPPETGTLSGKVLERIDAPPYSYLRVASAAGEQWAAVSQTDRKVGDTITIVNAITMDGFESKTLKRRFDHIVFGQLGDESTAAAGEAANPHIQVAAAPGVKVARAEGPGAATIAEVFAGRAALKDRPVAIRGRVVKFTGGVMGKNWLHLQDGSGSEATGDHDIAVTTGDTATVGEVVAVRGLVHLDRDFGAGYSYGVLIEDATLTR